MSSLSFRARCHCQKMICGQSWCIPLPMVPIRQGQREIHWDRRPNFPECHSSSRWGWFWIQSTKCWQVSKDSELWSLTHANDTPTTWNWLPSWKWIQSLHFLSSYLCEVEKSKDGKVWKQGVIVPVWLNFIFCQISQPCRNLQVRSRSYNYKGHTPRWKSHSKFKCQSASNYAWP